MDYIASFSQFMIDELARQQGEIFEYAQKESYNMDDFILKYMNCGFCNREMDADYSFFHFQEACVCFPYILEDCIIEKTSFEAFNSVGWVGEIYRYLIFKLEIPSKTLVTYLSPRELDNMYYTYEFNELEETVNEIMEKVKTKMSPNK